MSEIGIPDVPSSGAMPPWAVMGVQLLEALVQRLKSDDPGDGPEPDPPPGQAGPDAARLRRTCRFLSRHNEWVARALGACRCWGLNPGCGRCGGQGRAGTFDVDPQAFAELVAPLFRARPDLFARQAPPTVELVPEQ